MSSSVSTRTKQNDMDSRPVPCVTVTGVSERTVAAFERVAWDAGVADGLMV